jgi:DUF4097 and DUF4098 domain-containing protein YvlB
MSEQERIELEFSVGRQPRLDVANIRGSITVQVCDQGQIRVSAIKHKAGCAHPEQTEIDISQQGDVVIAKTSQQEQLTGRTFKPCRVDYTVSVPAHCDVTAKQVSGQVSVSGVDGQLNINAVQGAVDVQHVSGRTRVKVVNASVDGGDWRGRAEVDTVSGAVRIAESDLSRVKANTVSGDLSLSTRLASDGRYDFHSVSGDVTFYLPSESGVESRGTTLSGHLVCDLRHEFQSRTRRGWRATVNGGGPHVRFHSISGDLELLAANSK